MSPRLPRAPLGLAMLGLAVLGLAGLLACAEPPDYGVGPEVWSPPATHIGSDWLYSPSRINRIDLAIDAAGMEILRAQRMSSYPRDKVRAQASVDFEEVGDIGVRLRGGLGSFSPIDEKPKLELDLNLFTGERFYGLESISLNNMAEDCGGLRETLAYAAYGLAGLPTSRTGFAQLFVNGQDYGLMLTLETQDDRWLRRHFVDPDGNLYDGKYVFAGPWPAFVDFGLGKDHWFDLEEGEDIGHIDITEISDGALRAEERGQIGRSFRGLVDWEALNTSLRVEQWTQNGDAYGSLRNNYKVYFEPGRPMVMIPWDTGEAFTDVSAEGWEPPSGILGQVCQLDEVCAGSWEAQAAPVASALSDGRLLALAEEAAALTEEGLVGDPRGSCTEEEVSAERERLFTWLSEGAPPSP